MIEIKIQLDDIDYSGIAELAMPVVKEKLSENGGFLGGVVGKHIPEAALSGALNGFLNFLTPTQKDEIVLSLISKYENKIVDILQQTTCKHGVNLKVKGLSATNVNKVDK